MQCFYHPSQPAVGVCQACGRGLCRECAAEVNERLACRDRHEAMVRSLDDLTQHALTQRRRTRTIYLRNAAFYFLSGGAFVAFGASQLRWMGMTALLLLVLGVFLLLAALFHFLESRKYDRQR